MICFLDPSALMYNNKHTVLTDSVLYFCPNAECVTQIEPTTMTTTVNSTSSSLPLRLEEFPFTWSVTGYLSVAIAKILLSLISIQVNILLFKFILGKYFCFAEKIKDNKNDHRA
ncbi:hypothetical protein ILYODFUR_028333 [Ilyodon furcidens]|uniref:Uncharacterized protein n=1 Tax=Ilyodon furcidens TaxID=33524 RepID=A0ABV0TPA8_9TELE